MTFSEKLNAWLIAQGKEPIDDLKLCQAIDDAAKATLEDLRENRDAIVAEMQHLGARLAGQ